MTRRATPRPIIDGGLNTAVEFGGKTYHVQTQCSRRGDPIVESLVYQGGQTLIRFTASFDDGEGRRGFNADDGRHLIEQQHAKLIQKIRHGLLRGNEALDAVEPEPEEEPARLIDADGVVVDPSQIDDPGVCELLQELGVAIDSAMPEPKAPARVPGTRRPAKPKPVAKPVASPAPSRSARPLPWWRRFALTIRLRSR